jgi:hypothetical protein
VVVWFREQIVTCVCCHLPPLIAVESLEFHSSWMWILTYQCKEVHHMMVKPRQIRTEGSVLLIIELTDNTLNYFSYKWSWL